VTASTVSTPLQNERETPRLENVPVQARLDNALRIARMIRERMDQASSQRTKRTTRSKFRKALPAGPGVLEWAGWIQAVQQGVEGLLPVVRAAAGPWTVDLRGLEQTQSAEARSRRGRTIDRVV